MQFVKTNKEYNRNKDRFLLVESVKRGGISGVMGPGYIQTGDRKKLHDANNL